MDERWEEGKTSHWETINEECTSPKNLSFAEIRLNRDLSSQATDIDESELNNNDYNFIELSTINKCQTSKSFAIEGIQEIGSQSL